MKMKIRNSNISFKSSIQFLNREGFYKAIRDIPEENLVWSCTTKGIVRAPKAYTECVRTCTAGGILTKGRNENTYDVIFFHLRPPEEDCPENEDIGEIERVLKEKLAGGKPLQGIIIGCKSLLNKSGEFFDAIEQVFRNLGTPYSKFKNQIEWGSLDVAYKGTENKWLINAEEFSPDGGYKMGNPNKHFEEAKLYEGDCILL